MDAPLIRTASLAKDYLFGDTHVAALAGVTLEIAAGEFVAVMGPSGSGKSTFMNLLGCLDPPSSGSYQLAGADVSRLSDDALAQLRNRRIGFVFQHFNLLPRTTALDNVALPLLYRGLGGAQRRARAARRLEQVGLAGYLAHHPAQLSGGQQQRVAIARALVGDPDLLLADEPTGALDSRTGVEIMALLQELNRAGITIVLVTHEHDIAACADRIIRFRDGRVVDDHANTRRDAAAALASAGDNSPAHPQPRPHGRGDCVISGLGRPGAGDNSPAHPQPRSTDGFAQPSGYGGAKQCFAKPSLRPPGRGDFVISGLGRPGAGDKS